MPEVRDHGLQMSNQSVYNCSATYDASLVDCLSRRILILIDQVLSFSSNPPVLARTAHLVEVLLHQLDTLVRHPSMHERSEVHRRLTICASASRLDIK